MATESSINSNAFNFFNHMQSGVDSRTGLYSFQIALSAFYGSDLLAPEIELNLRYSQLNTQDRGFGRGWSLPTTEFDPAQKRRIISLANGETFKADGRVGTTNQLTMSEKKIDTFHLYEDAEDRWRVVHRSGMVEVLERKGSSTNGRAVPTRIFSRQGHWLNLEYGTHNGFPMLTKITDMRGVTLLEAVRNRDVQLRMPTDTGNATYTMVLGTDNRVTRIELPTDNQASWRFSYIRVRNVDCISTVYTPAGGFEELKYDDYGHEFPIGSGLDPLPRVTRHVQHPGNKQPPIDTRYTYSSNGHNFLGGNAPLEWIDDGLDNLFRKDIDYDYATTETLWVDERPVRSTVREFNKFHLNTREAVYRGTKLNADNTEVIGNFIEEKITTYNLKPGRFEEQVNACQYPIKIETRWRLRDSGRQRVETIRAEYDDYGNVLMQQAATGVVETNRWYRNGDAGYPGNAENFVCDLHTKTVTPAAGHGGNAPTLVTTHTYNQIKVLASSSEATGQESWCALHSETLSLNDRTLKVTAYDYHEQENEEVQQAEPLQHGRLQKRTTGFPNPAFGEPGQPEMLESTVDYAYQFETLDWDKMRDERLHDLAPITVLKTVHDTVGHDQASMQTSEGHSLFSGELVLSTDEDRVERRIVTDKLHRKIFEVVAGGGASEAVRSNEYALCAEEGEQASQRYTSPTSVITETRFDGLGRVHQVLASHIDPTRPNALFQVQELVHDAWGREIEDRQYDWLEDKPFPADVPFLAQRYLYDNWEGRSVVIRHDNVQEHTLFDPTVEDQNRNVCKTTWLQVAQQTEKSEKVRTWSNAFEKEVRIERLSPDDMIEAEQVMHYDGLGRCVSKIDERQYETTFEYDPFGRLSASTRPTETRIEHRYAHHTDAEWSTSITAFSNRESDPPFEVGSQCYNGVGKVTSRTIGKRTEELRYKPGQSKPAAMITGARDTISYEYDLALSPFPTQMRVNADEKGDEYIYDPITARMKESRGANGKRVYHYNAHDQLTGETLETAGDVPRTAEYVSTFHNRLTSSKDAGGMTAVHEYDEKGLITATRQGNLLASFGYNGLGRLISLTSTDTVSNSTLTTSLEYDDHGREIKRTQQLDTRPLPTLTQVWGKDNLLESRVLRDGPGPDDVVLEEAFRYDRLGRLSTVEYSGREIPKDEAGRTPRQQAFDYDSIDNIRVCITRFDDGTSEIATYEYNKDDRFLLKSLTLSTSGSTPETFTFSHDANGNLTVDQHGRVLEYDEESQLLQIRGQSQYQYDGEGQLLTSQAASGSPRQLWFDENRLSLAIQDGNYTRFSFHADIPLAQQSDAPARTLLLQTDSSHSVIAECEAGAVRDIRYSAYGQRHVTVPVHSNLGFNGEALDEGSDWYLLGRGVRAYNPGLRRFNSPDPRSVFDTGELNPYTYCLNNPIALRDPSGLTATGDGGRPRRPDEDDPNWLGRRKPGGGTLNWIMLGLGVALTVAAVFTAGASLAAVGALGAAAKAGMSAATLAVRAGTAGFLQKLLVKVAATTIKAALTNTLFAGLSLGGTVAQAVSVINNDEAAGTAAMILGITTATVAAGKVALSVGKLAFSGSNANNLVPTGIVQNAASNMDKAAGATSGGFKEGGFLYRHWMSRIPESQRFHVNTPY